MDTQELRDGVIALINESARNACQSGGGNRGEDPDLGGTESERPSKRRCDVTLDVR
jgi:hypothetical protein